MMKLPWSKSETKSAQSLIALSQLPVAAWGRSDPASLVRDGYTGNAIAYRCVRMIAEAAASISLNASDDRVGRLLVEPSPDEAGQALLERLYTDLQITGNAWLEGVTPVDQSKPRGLFGLRADCVSVRQDKAGNLIGYPISQSGDAPNYGGTPSDQAVLEGIAALKAAKIGVTLSPFLLMDIPPGNGLPDPYGGAEQAAFPWRGRKRSSGSINRWTPIAKHSGASQQRDLICGGRRVWAGGRRSHFAS
jgi:hypothetical protein